MNADFSRLLRALESCDVEFLIIGGVAAAIHGAARTTFDLDILYRRTRDNVGRLVSALAPLNPYLRGAPPGLPFHFDVETIWRGCNFTLSTDAGPLDCLGEVTGIGAYDAADANAIDTEAHGVKCRVIDLDDLIAAKRAAGRPKDFEAIAELEIIREERGRNE
ncbi:MAG TPA: nucleotidyltransferase [Thermoanaerobaculia bacterium]|nr:nucleotidyltransferase [Thermoanaerobaculia bacterium]